MGLQAAGAQLTEGLCCWLGPSDMRKIGWEDSTPTLAVLGRKWEAPAAIPKVPRMAPRPSIAAIPAEEKPSSPFGQKCGAEAGRPVAARALKAVTKMKVGRPAPFLCLIW